MRLDLNAFRLIESPLTKGIAQVVHATDKNTKSAYDIQPFRLTIQKVMDSISNKGTLNVNEIVEASGVSQAAVYRSVNLMVEKGVAEFVFVPRKNGRGTNYVKLTGSDIGNIPEVLRNSKVNKMQDNNKSGVSGVHFNKHCNKWFCTFGRKVSIRFDSLFDAVCKRKSLELAA